MFDDVLLVGCGPIAIEYSKVLQSLGKRFSVLGRGEESSKKFERTTNIKAVTGGIPCWLKEQEKLPGQAIVAVSEDQLGDVCLSLLDHGVRRILVEKPGGASPKDVLKVSKKAQQLNAEIFVGYNRRFYASALKAREIALSDGGIKSFHFEFTEWSHIVGQLHKPPGIKERWFLHNSTHVIDLAFHLGGWPRKITCHTLGGLDWHPTAVYAGAGVSESGALFSYHANWCAPGRWGVEWLSNNHRLILRPLEKLQIQKLGSVAIETVDIDDDVDNQFKPGLLRQVDAFFKQSPDDLLTIHKQVERLRIYAKMNLNNTTDHR